MKIELFNQLYSCYYSTVYHILKEAGKRELTEEEFCALVRKTSDVYGFSETTDLIIEGAIKAGTKETVEDNKDAWPFFDRSEKRKRYYIINRLRNITGFPLTLLEKMWLKSIYFDPRIRLFLADEIDLSELDDIEPLFDWNDFVLFDQYSDGDPFQDKTYIEMFRKVLKGLRNHARLEIEFRKPNNNISFNADGSFESAPDRGIGTLYIDPDYLEYSERDDKFRLIGNNPDFGRNMVNISSIVSCSEAEKTDVLNMEASKAYSKTEFQREVIFELTDDNNTLERFLFNFSHYEKTADYLKEDKKYRITITYDETDEKDLVIRTLSFGPHIRVMEPKHFVELIKDRLWSQKDLMQG